MSALADWRPNVPVAPLRKTLIAAVHPLAAGVAQFNGALARAMAEDGHLDVISWRRLYPPLLHKGQEFDPSSPHPDGPVPSLFAHPGTTMLFTVMRGLSEP